MYIFFFIGQFVAAATKEHFLKQVCADRCGQIQAMSAAGWVCFVFDEQQGKGAGQDDHRIRGAGG